MENKDLLIEVGKLAGLVSGHLHAVDKNTTNHNSHGGLANKININNFINSIKNNSLPPPSHTDMSPMFSPAYVDEAEVQMSVPDVSKFSVKIENSPENLIKNVTSHVPQNLPFPVQKTEIPSNINIQEIVEDIKSIKSTLSSINNNFTKISGMVGKVFNFITEKERKKN